jgi:hypothetical protein
MKIRGRKNAYKPCNIDWDQEVETVTKLDRLYL